MDRQSLLGGGAHVAGTAKRDLWCEFCELAALANLRQLPAEVEPESTPEGVLKNSSLKTPHVSQKTSVYPAY